MEDNIIHDTQNEYSENLTINGYVDGFTIRRAITILQYRKTIGIDAAGSYDNDYGIPALMNFCRETALSLESVCFV